ARVLLDVDEVLDVRDRALVELFRIAVLEHQPEIAVVVRQHDDVAPRRLPARQLGLDLVVEGLVVVDVLDVVDVDAELLLERDEGREAVVLLVRVDVERPVGEVKRLRELVRRRGAATTATAASASASCQESGDGEDRSARRSAAEK